MWLPYYTRTGKKRFPAIKIGKWGEGFGRTAPAAALMIWGPLKCQTTSKQNYHYILRGSGCYVHHTNTPQSTKGETCHGRLQQCWRHVDQFHAEERRQNVHDKASMRKWINFPSSNLLIEYTWSGRLLAQRLYRSYIQAVTRALLCFLLPHLK